MDQAPEVESAAGPSEADALRLEGDRIERLLEDVQRSAGPTTWPKVEEVVQRLVGLYGAGLERVLSHAREAGAMTPELWRRLTGDELVSSLLLLHGLHPSTVEDRVRRALDEVRPYLRSHSGGVELLGVEPDGRVRLRLEGTCSGCHSSAATVEHTLRAAIEEAAPEVTAIEVESAPARHGEAPIPLGTPARGGSAKHAWIPVFGWARAGEGRSQVREIAGVEVLFLEVGEAVLAYRNACAACRAPLHRATLEGETLRCECGAVYDVARAGRPLEGESAGLEPFPLLLEGPVVRISLPGVAP